ncbi:MAG: Asp23/Gls24 family envelope stress response protein [Lachnospiraceae bacterium]|nr:Asp23/Gls24 family envelope stress response protein [Lachnospiraceae bacterium]MEE3433622.1 Asp23/Gls24 family envelope stress response protein [Lachnospiraceae bacterium]
MAEKNYQIQDGVDVSEHVLATIAGLAAAEVEGVAVLNGGLTSNMIAKAPKSRLAKAVRVINNEDNTLTVQAIIVVKYGYTIIDVSTQVQEKVKNAIENMTELTVRSVDVKVSNVSVPNRAE